ncbi:MAG TPA: thioesterase family protein [Pseudonocardia sp.]|nr:thioesterase family protein [Pseudonocardia sp.]
MSTSFRASPPFRAALAVEPLGEDLFGAVLGTDWTIGPKAHGGLLMALLAQAGLARLAAAAPGAAPDPLAVAADFLRAPDPGPVELRTDVLRPGRTASVVAVRLRQDGRTMMTATVTAGRLPTEPPVWAQLPDLPAEPPPDALDPATVDPISGVARSADLRWDPAAVSFLRGEPGQPVIRGWARPRGEPTDVLFAMLAGDVLPPTVFNLGGERGWAPTVQLTALLRAHPTPGWLRMESRASSVGGGWFDEDVTVLDTAGRLVCQARQLALAPKLGSPP